MFIKIRLKSETYKILEKFCKKNNIELNNFIENTILEKIQSEIIKETMKIKNIFEITENDFLEEEIESINIDDKIKH